MTYGTLTHHESTTDSLVAWRNQRDCWGIKAQPHVMIRLKRLFPRVAAHANGRIYLTDTTETAREIEWVLQRFPLSMSDDVAELLRKRSKAHLEREQAIDAIYAGHVGPLNLGQPGMTPRPHQEQFVAMAKIVKRLLLADDLGLGKTISSSLLFGLPDSLPALIVVPTHLPRHWVEKLAELWPLLRVHVATKGTAYDLTKIDGMAGQPPDVLIVGYSKLAGWADALAGQVQTVIFDEVQDLRNGDRTEKGGAAARVARAANYVVGCSATPVYNYGSEIHNITDIIAPDALGNREEFLREWGGSGATGNEKVRDPAALGTYLRDAGLLLRRTRAETHQEMPEPLVIEETVESDAQTLDELSGDVAAIARLILNQSADRKERFVAAGDLDWRLRQATGVAKAPYVAEFVRLLLESADKLVLWGWHRAVYEIWMNRLLEFNPVLYTGSESPKQKNAAEDAFKSGQSRVLIMSLRSGAGLDGLQKSCSVGVFGELDWSPEQHKQCIGRLDRDGQTATPAIYYLVSEDGSDPVISEVLQVKRQQAEPIRDPNRPLFEKIASSDDRMRLLAEAALKRSERLKKSA